MKSYEVNVGGDDGGAGGKGSALQGSVDTGSVNTAAIAEESHGLSAFGTSLGTIEFWDSRARTRVACLRTSPGTDIIDGREEVTALEFHPSGLSLAAGSSAGLVRLYDLRSPTPILQKDQGYGFPIHTLMYLSPSSTSTHSISSEPKLLSADKRIIKIWEPDESANSKPWTYIEPAVDINSVAWCKDSGMLLTANEGRQQHSFFIPQLGPAPKWCSFLDNLVEEMAEDASDPSAYTNSVTAPAGEVYDNYKFLTIPQLETLNLSHLIGTTSLLRPYMHGFFVAQRLYEEAKVIADPFIFEEQRNRRIREKIEKERESRIRGNAAKKNISAKVNKQLARKLAEREDAQAERRMRMLEQDEQAVMAERGNEDTVADTDIKADAEGAAQGRQPKKSNDNLLTDSRFSRLFSDEDFAIDESSREFQALNPNKSKRLAIDDSADAGDGDDDNIDPSRFLTAVEREILDAQDARNASSSDNDNDDDDDDDEHYTSANKPTKISTPSYKKSGHRSQRPDSNSNSNPKMHISSSTHLSSSASKPPHHQRTHKASDRSFGTRISKNHLTTAFSSSNGKPKTVRGGKEISFIPAPTPKDRKTDGRRIPDANDDEGGAGNGGEVGSTGKGRRNGKDRRSASGNVFRGL